MHSSSPHSSTPSSQRWASTKYHVANAVRVVARRIVYVGLCVFLFVALGANKACREDYFFATQTRLAEGTPTETPEPTVAATETPDGDGGIDDTPTPTPTVSGTASIVATATPASAVSGEVFPLSALQALENSASSVAPNALPTATVSPQSGAPMAVGGGAQGLTDNWLGNLYGAGESDGAEEDSGTNAGGTVLIVSEDEAFQRSVSTVLQGLGVSTSAVTDEIELEDTLDNSVAIAVLDGGSRELRPCDAVGDIRDQQPPSVVGAMSFVVIAGPESSGAANGSAFVCDGGVIGEVVSRPLNRVAMAKAIERATQRSGRSSLIESSRVQ